MDAESIFKTFFWPLYPADAQSDPARARATDANPGKNPSFDEHLASAASVFVGRSRDLFDQDLTLDGTDDSVHRLSAALTIEVRDRWANTGGPGTPESTLFNAVVHGAAYVGQCIVKNHGGVWAIRRPLWESVVHLRSPAGEGDLTIFHWWLKSLSDDAIGAGRSADSGQNVTLAATLADRYRAHVEVPTSAPTSPPFVTDANRPLPRIAKPRYAVLHKYIKAHVPELRDLGADFPAPERWDELGLKWLDVRLLGDGRMVLLSGAGSHGLHLFWLGERGFQKAAFYPCDAFPDPVVRAEGPKLVMMLSFEGETRVHEVLWWGP